MPDDRVIFRLPSTLIIKLGLSVSMFVVVVAVTPLLLDNNSPMRPRIDTTQIQIGALTDLNRRMVDIEAHDKQLQEQVRALSGKKAPTQAKLAAQVNGLDVQVKKVNGQVAELRDAIQEDPVKALRLPLMARDVRSVREANEAAIDRVAEDIDRQYDLMKFVVGTLALSIIGTLTTVLIALLKGKGNGEGGGSPSTPALSADAGPPLSADGGPSSSADGT